MLPLTASSATVRKGWGLPCTRLYTAMQGGRGRALRAKVMTNLTSAKVTIDWPNGEGGHRNQSCSEFDERPKCGDFPRGVRDPEIKSVGNCLKRVDPQTKLVYGDGKCLKNTKNYKASNLPMNCKGLIGNSPSTLSDNKFRDTQLSRKCKSRKCLNSYISYSVD